ncbi:MAG: hypothetical protein ACU843_10285, partial [Gammaproteobacteria bacterium]
VCNRSDCRQVAAQQECMLPVGFERYLRLRSQRIRASIERDKTRTKIIEEVCKKERDENQGFWRAKHEELPGLPRDGYPLTPIPSCRRPIVNLSEKRRRSFRDQLNRILSEAVAERLRRPPEGPEEADEAPIDPRLSAILTKCCTLCAGGCCTRGGDHAYLSKQTLLGVLNARPDLRPRQILENYLERVPAKSYRDSCIFHSSTGCALPPGLRSSTCSHYFCPGLEAFAATFQGPNRPLGAFVIVRSREPWDSPGDPDNRIDRAFILTHEASRAI